MLLRVLGFEVGMVLLVVPRVTLLTVDFVTSRGGLNVLSLLQTVVSLAALLRVLLCIKQRRQLLLLPR